VSSRIAAIVDYTAQRAALIQGLVNPLTGVALGVRAVYGAGQNLYADPLRPGQMIQPAPERPLEPFSHVSDLPDAPTVEYISQSGLVQFTWTVPMRLHVQRGDLASARATLLPFYDGYEAAFVPDPTLGGLCLVSEIKTWKPAADEDWVWLDIDLSVTEEVHY
jgi:hypothetical protein